MGVRAFIASRGGARVGAVRRRDLAVVARAVALLRCILNSLAVVLLVGLALAASTAVRAASPADEETARIEYLLEGIAKLADAQFVRNGASYDAAAAVAHLRSKWRWARGSVVTAEDFIAKCASRSSVTGEPYLIRYADGRTETAEAYFRRRLARYPLPARAAPGRD